MGTLFPVKIHLEFTNVIRNKKNLDILVDYSQYEIFKLLKPCSKIIGIKNKPKYLYN